MRCQRIVLGSLCILGWAANTVQAQDWHQWRGPQQNGIANDNQTPTEWNQKDHVLWRSPLPGPGGATPVIAGSKLFVTSSKGDDLVLLAFDRNDGKLLWEQVVTNGNQNARAGEGNSASPSPCTDGELVWCMFGNGVLACYKLDGKEMWKFQVADRFGPVDIQFGLTSTPTLDQDGLFLQLIHGPMRGDDDTRTGKVIRLDKRTGKTIWEIDRITDAKFECKHSYASPLVYRDRDRAFLIVHGADCTTGHDLASGKELWRFATLNGPNVYNSQKHDPTFRFVASPNAVDGLLIIPTAKAGPTIALKIDDQLRGDVSSKTECVQWACPQTPDVSIPLIVDDLVYLLHKDGKLQCLDRKTGEQVYFERTHTAQHRTSPVYADGKIYFCDRDGHCTVVAAGRDFKILADNDMGEPITASPIFSNGILYLRSYDALYAIGS